jgi:hypothetical protein
VVELRGKLARLVSTGEATNRWEDANKLANLDLGFYRTASDARQAMAALNAFSLGFARKTGVVTREQTINGLGNEAWVLRGTGSGVQVTYHWRRGTLVIEAHVHCFGVCPVNVGAATRAWVDAIDAEVRARS